MPTGTRAAFVTPARLLGWSTCVVALAVIEALVRLAIVNPFLVPLPSLVTLSLGRLLIDGSVLQAFLLTAGEALIAGMLIAVIGLPLGLVLQRNITSRIAFEGWIAAAAAAPIALAYPLFLVMFGRSWMTATAMGTLAGLFPLTLKTLEGLAGTRRCLIDVGLNMGLDSRAMALKILLPAALPTIFAGLRLGMIFALINIVGLQFLINLDGLGQLINNMAERYDLPGTYAAVLLVVAINVMFFVALEHLERRAVPSHSVAEE